MQEFINHILDWPVIAQSAAGSALFWLILIIGNKLTKYGQELYSKISSHHKERLLLSRLMRVQSMSDDRQESSHYLTCLIFGAFKYANKGLIFLTLGLVFQSVIPVFGVIGYVVAIYYFFMAADVTRDTRDFDDRDEEADRLLEEIDKLQK